jgi:hypothetical protein
MIVSGILFIIACLVFAAYNALSIKQHTNTWQWHVLQYAFLALLLFGGFGDWFYKSVAFWAVGDFHNFGRNIVVWALFLILGATVYVYGLHWILPKVEKWKSKK